MWFFAIGRKETMYAIRKSGVWVLTILLLFLQDWQLAGISVRTWLIYLYTVLLGVIVLKEKKTGSAGGKEIRKRKWEPFDCLLGIFLVWNILQIVTDSLGTGRCEERNFFAVAVILLFFVISMEETPVSADGLLICSTLLFAGLFWRFFVDPSFTFNLRPLLQDEQALTAFLLLTGMIAAGKYCETEDKVKKHFYFMAALSGNFLLFVNGNIVGKALMGFFFPVLLLLHEPTKAFVKRVMEIAFTYFFLWANMPLVTRIFPKLLEEKPYSMEGGVFLELLMAVAGVFFFSYWEKLGEEEKPLYAFQKAVGWILAAAGLLFFLLLSKGSRLDGIKGGYGGALLQQFSAELRNYCGAHNGTFFDVLEHYGIYGVIWLFGIVFTAGKRMQKQIRRKKVSPVLAALFAMYLPQSLFFSQSPVTVPVYAVLMAGAMYGDVRKKGEEE